MKSTEEDLIKKSDIFYFQRMFFKMVKYGIDYTEDMINELEEFYKNEYELDEEIGLRELYKQAMNERKNMV